MTSGEFISWLNQRQDHYADAYNKDPIKPNKEMADCYWACRHRYLNTLILNESYRVYKNFLMEWAEAEPDYAFIYQAVYLKFLTVR